MGSHEEDLRSHGEGPMGVLLECWGERVMWGWRVPSGGSLGMRVLYGMRSYEKETVSCGGRGTVTQESPFSKGGQVSQGKKM